MTALFTSLMSVLAALALQAPGAPSLTGVASAQSADATSPAQPAPPAPAARFDDPELVLGVPTAPVTVVEYFSNTCPHCAAFDRDTFPYVEERYVRSGKVRYIFRELPTAPTEMSGAGFILARCAGKDRYLATVRDIFHHQDALFHSVDERPLLIEIGRRAGLTVDQMQACLDDDAAFERLNIRLRTAVAAGAEATPTFVFNGRMLKPGDRLGDGAYEGGELSKRQFDLALRDATARFRLGSRPPHVRKAQH